jgi:phage I-like protein
MLSLTVPGLLAALNSTLSGTDCGWHQLVTLRSFQRSDGRHADVAK